MKRDMDLVRKILLAMEELQGFPSGQHSIDGYSETEIGYHVSIMDEAGLLVAADTTHPGSPHAEALPMRVTWEGHEFLASARNETIWKQAKSLALKTAGGLSIAALKVALTTVTSKAINGEP